MDNYVSFEDVTALKDMIDKRRTLEKRLKELKQLVPKEKQPGRQNYNFKTKVRIGNQLEAQIALVGDYKKRECISLLRDYVFGPRRDKVLIIYGLRRTGKTTMIRQILSELPDEEFMKAAFIQVTTREIKAMMFGE